MKTYDEFHGETHFDHIEKDLRTIVLKEKEMFKILTGYGRLTGKSKSRQKVLTSLKKFKQEGIIKDYFPGEVKNKLLDLNSPYYDAKTTYGTKVKTDNDYGNEGIIFVFIK